MTEAVDIVGNPIPVPLIHGKLLALRKAIGGIKAKTTAGGARFPVKSSKELMDKLRDAVDELELVVYIVEQEVIPLHVDTIPDDRGREGAMKAGGTCCYVRDTVRIEAADGSYRDFKGCGAGMDKDDKAAGKASTYAWKDALLKGLSIPDKDMVDSDDEEGAGKTVKPARAVKPGTVQGTAEAEALAAIQSAGSVTALATLADLLRRLPVDAQKRLTPAYTKRKAELEAAAPKETP